MSRRHSADRVPRERNAARAWFLLLACLAGLLIAEPQHALAQIAVPHQPPLSTEARARLTQASADVRLAPWQRAFMRELVGARPPGAGGVDARPLASFDPAHVTADDGSWTQFFAPAGAREAHAAIYDPVRDRMVVFGGYEDGSSLADTWVLMLGETPLWTLLTPSGTPPSACYGHSAIYDPVRDRMVVFGGWDGSRCNDVWVLSFAGTPAWSRMTPAGTPPSARFYHSAVYDTLRDRMLIFGGDDGSYCHDTWALSFGATPAWSMLTPSGAPPSARAYHAAVYDPVRDRMLVYGGSDGSLRSDTWALALGGTPAWTELTPSGTPPLARVYHSAIYDPDRDAMVIFGGYDGARLNDSWELTLAATPTWTQFGPTGTPPSGRYCHSAIYDPMRNRMLVFGGNDGADRNDTWALGLAGAPAWSPLDVSGAPPSARLYPTAIYDPVRDRMVVFGGICDNGLQADTWALSLAGTPAWTQLIPSGTPPSARQDHTAIYDPVRDRMLVFGGNDGAERNDTWALTFAGTPAWNQLAPSGTPPSKRYSHTAIYDPVRDRMVIFGGIWADTLGHRLNDVWALSLAGTPAWSQLTPSGTLPGGRYCHTAVYDPVRDRMLVFGGYGSSSILNDTWALSFAGTPTWGQLAPAGTLPAGRACHTAIYDPIRDRMVVFGGTHGSLLGDTWALSVTGSPAWIQLVPSGTLPPALAFHAAIYDPIRDCMLVFGGYDVAYSNHTWALEWEEPASVAGAPGSGHSPLRHALHPNTPNPFNPATMIHFDIPESAGRVVLGIYDVGGRLVRSLVDAAVMSGSHEVVWDGRDGQGRLSHSGVYFCRLEANGRSETIKMVLSR